MSAVSKGKGLKFDLPPVGVSPAAPAAQSEPVTGVMRHAGLAQELHSLRAQVQQLEGERGAQALDARLVRPSRWANRHAVSFEDEDFAELKAEIAGAGGNVQPIKVRPLREPGADDGARYEIVFGHRRHRACLELGLPVLAVVSELDDRALFAEMDRENRSRKNLSAYEQGVMYRRALKEGLFPSQRMLAVAVGADSGNVSRAIKVAELPEEILAAFGSPLAVQFAWASDLTDALQRDREAALAAAREAVRCGMAPLQAFSAITGKPARKGAVRYSTPNAAPDRPDVPAQEAAVPQAAVPYSTAASERSPAIPAVGPLLCKDDVMRLVSEADRQQQHPDGAASAGFLRDLAQRIARSLGDDAMVELVRAKESARQE
ncbi:ParB/RepB/Spo0J family partition protein [uncultured Azohydromonas sp.]|jgi:ParB-like partition proteins|uniref:ParB/RepB/Spo0J family partition protein n=1 Tax=uncultured Azohydromonas sp. TaxID=487342 RepID=UPI0026244913|nr:ParB/RepB/Spo0J family partition protein [uncultured Azohydromonas sp.]